MLSSTSFAGPGPSHFSQCRRGAVYQLDQPDYCLDPSRYTPMTGHSSQSYSPAPFSSWDLNTQVASTPHLEESISWNHPFVNSQNAFHASSANAGSRRPASIPFQDSQKEEKKGSVKIHLLEPSVIDTIDQWLLDSSSCLVNDDTEKHRDAKDKGDNQSLSHRSSRPINVSTPLLPPQQPLILFDAAKTLSRAIITQSFTANPSPSYQITKDIVLRSRDGDPKEDVYYPQSHLHSDLAQGLALSMPPAADFCMELGDMAARHQVEKRRSNEDLYTPLWVRGEGSNREGWCHLCTPGCWLNLKTSQYLYHVQNTHGIVQNTGQICNPPLQLRLCQDNLDSTDALCGHCQEWIPICSARKRRTFSAWFQHARKCHSPPHQGKNSRLITSTPLHQRRAMSSSPAIRLRATKASNHQRMRSFQGTSSYTMHPHLSSDLTNRQIDLDFTDGQSQKKIRLFD